MHSYIKSLLVTLLFSIPVYSAENTPPNIQPFEIPTFEGNHVNWEHPKPAINKLPEIDGDAIFNIINKCYPLKSGFGLEINFKTGLNYRPSNSNTIQTADSANYYAGIVANMPLYSDIEVDKERKLEYARRTESTSKIETLITATATKRRAERMLGLYAALEKRSQQRVKNGIAAVDEQIGFLEKVAAAQGELETAKAQLEGARLALIGQCRPDTVEQVNNYILHEIGAKR